MCKTPFAATVPAPAPGDKSGSLAASWTRSREPDASRRPPLPAVVGIVPAWAVLDGHGSRDGALATAGIGGDRLRGGRDLPRAAWDASAPAARPGRAGHRLRRRRPDPLGRSVYLVVDRRRPVVELARPWPRLPRVPRARSARGCCGRRPARCGTRGAGGRRRDRLGLLGVAIPSLFPDGDRIARLREPVGYWNALALLADAALALGLWVARSTRVMGRLPGCSSSTARRSWCSSRSRAPAWSGRSPCSPSGSSSLRAARRCGARGRGRGAPLLVAGWAFTRPALSRMAPYAPTAWPTARCWRH